MHKLRWIWKKIEKKSLLSKELLPLNSPNTPLSLADPAFYMIAMSQTETKSLNL